MLACLGIGKKALVGTEPVCELHEPRKQVNECRRIGQLRAARFERLAEHLLYLLTNLPESVRGVIRRSSR